MLNQSFSASNFRKIFDYENRKGVYLEAEFFQEVVKITQELKKFKTKFRELKKKKDGLSQEEYESEKSSLNQKKMEFKEKKENLLTEELEKISAKITDGGFELTIRKIPTPSGKIAYSLEHNPCSYFAIKQIQYNIRRLYGVKQSNRDNIVSQLKIILGDTFPKYVVRTDIESFYEAIPRKILLKKINEEPLLTLASKKIVWKILRDYGKYSGSSVGIPRGIGISAYLSELYMRGFDNTMREHPDIVYYARYVDDIVAIFIPKPSSNKDGYLEAIKTRINELGLNINSKKTECIDLMYPKNHTFDYLGYKYTFGTTETVLNLSTRKLDRFKTRIDLALSDYDSRSKNNEKKARKLLVKRVRFLTGNTRLLNSKSNALVGIYFSNKHLSDASPLKSLDKYLEHKVSGLTSEPLRNRLKCMSFVDGFEQKRFTKYTTTDLSLIVSAWKNET